MLSVQVKLPSQCPSLCGIAKEKDLIYVVTAEGFFYQYKVPHPPPPLTVNVIEPTVAAMAKPSLCRCTRV
jgi:hypothetical protein